MIVEIKTKTYKFSLGIAKFIQHYVSYLFLTNIHIQEKYLIESIDINPEIKNNKYNKLYLKPTSSLGNQEHITILFTINTLNGTKRLYKNVPIQFNKQGLFNYLETYKSIAELVYNTVEQNTEYATNSNRTVCV